MARDGCMRDRLLLRMVFRAALAPLYLRGLLVCLFVCWGWQLGLTHARQVIYHELYPQPRNSLLEQRVLHQK